MDFGHIIVFAIGCFIGWNIPIPAWALATQEKVKSWFKSKSE